MQFIDEIRQKTEAFNQAKLAQAAKEYEANKLKEEKRLAELIAKVAHEIFPAAKQAIREAAEIGKTHVSYEICHWQEDGDYLQDRYREAYELEKLLKAEGFEADIRTYTNSPSGSDSFFAHTCYDVYVDISW